jgi:two-component system NtrC family sensor kinase
MGKGAGLRAEIIATIAFLIGAALLLGGLLLLRVTEVELVNQRVASVTSAMEVLGEALAVRGEGAGTTGSLRAGKARRLFQTLVREEPVQSWRLMSAQLAPVAGGGRRVSDPLARQELARVRLGGEPLVQVQYPSLWNPFVPRQESSVLVTVPLVREGGFDGALQARFSLQDVQRRVQGAGRLVLLYVLLYGTVLILAGIYLLGRNVVAPVRRLMTATRHVTAGDLEQLLPEEGPKEIAELAGSFNGMMEALKGSRQEREGHIASLKAANEELRRTQEELIRSEKLASVGHLAAGMAHEIGNPLGALVGYLELLRRGAQEPELKDIASRALTESARIDRLVRDLLDYAAPAHNRPEPVDPAAVLAGARDLLLNQGALEEVRLQNRLPARLPKTAISPHKLQQVMVNLLLNARDAAIPGGWVRLEGGADGCEVWVSVADGGGLGLAVCQRVIAEARGRIEARSTIGEETCLTVRLPVWEGTDRES